MDTRLPEEQQTTVKVCRVLDRLFGARDWNADSMYQMCRLIDLETFVNRQEAELVLAWCRQYRGELQ